MIIPTFLENPIFSDDPRRDLEEIFWKLPTFSKVKKKRVKISEEEFARLKLSFYKLVLSTHSFIYSPVHWAGRPSEITPEKLSKFLCLLSEGFNIEETAPVCGFSPAGFYRFQKKNPEFRNEIARIVERHMLSYLAHMSLVLLLEKWDPKATMYVLQKTDPDFRTGKYIRKPRQAVKHHY